MNQDSNKLFLENNKIIFPLTLSEAVKHLAEQDTGNIQSGGKKKNQIYNKTWQQLSVRLRLIFNSFPKTLYRDNYEFNFNEDAENCLQHQLSTTNSNRIIKKLLYIYCAVTMHYIQHLDSALLPENLPQKWIQKGNNRKLDLSHFSQEIREITNCIFTKPQEDDLELKAIKLDALPTQTIIKLINRSEIIVNATYDYVKENCISYQKMRSLLSGIDEYSGKETYIRLRKNFCRLRIERILSGSIEDCKYFYNEFKILETIYCKASKIINESAMEGNYTTQSSLVARWDELSKTETEISPLEFEFFSYLLQIIPPRTKENKHNISNRLSRGKWYVLPVEVRNKIVDYITKMFEQPNRLARFLCIPTSDDDGHDEGCNEEGDVEGDEEYDEKLEEMRLQIKDICSQIQFPHQYKAYRDLESIEQQEIFSVEKLDNTIKKITKIRKELLKARQETV